MRADINRNGMITISADTECDAYALRQWAKENDIPAGLIVDGDTVPGRMHLEGYGNE